MPPARSSCVLGIFSCRICRARLQRERISPAKRQLADAAVPAMHEAEVGAAALARKHKMDEGEHKMGGGEGVTPSST